MFENSLNYSFLRLPSFYLARFPRIYPDHDIHPSLLNARVSVFWDIAGQLFSFSDIFICEFHCCFIFHLLQDEYHKLKIWRLHPWLHGLQFLPIMTDHSGFNKSQPRDVGSVRKSETWWQNYFAQLWGRVQHLNFSSKGGNLNHEQKCLHTVHSTNHQRLPMQMSSSWIRLWKVVDLAQNISRRPSKTNS